MNAHTDVGEGTNNPQVLLAKLVRTGCPKPPIFYKGVPRLGRVGLLRVCLQTRYKNGFAILAGFAFASFRRSLRSLWNGFAAPTIPNTKKSATIPDTAHMPGIIAEIKKRRETRIGITAPLPIKKVARKSFLRPRCH